MKHLFHFAYFFPPKQQIRFRGKKRSAILPFEGRKIVRTWDLDVSVQPIDVRSTSPGCHGTGRVENRTLFSHTFLIATCQLSTKIQDCRTGKPVAPCWGDHFSIGSNVLLPTCPASRECSVNLSPWISDFSALYLCPTSVWIKSGCKSGCMQCMFQMFQCLLMQYESIWSLSQSMIRFDTWHLTWPDGNCNEASCWNFKIRSSFLNLPSKDTKDRKSCLKSPTSLGKIDWLISRHRQIPRHSRQVSTGSRSLPSLCGFKGGFSVIKTSVDRSGSSSWGLILKPT